MVPFLAHPVSGRLSNGLVRDSR